MNPGFFRFAVARSRFVAGLVLLSVFVLGAFFVAFYAEVRPDRTMQGILQAMPPVFRSLLGGDYLDLISVPGFLAMNYKHPLVLLCGCAAVVTLASRGLAGEVGSGTIDLVLTHPVRRWAAVVSYAVVLIVLAGLLGCALWLGHRVGLALFPVPIQDYAGRFLPVVVHASLFYFFLGMLSLLVSAASGSRGRAVGVIVTLIGVFLFVEVGAELYRPLGWMKNLTPFGYFEPARVVRAGQVLVHDAWGLAVGGVVLLAAALWIFSRRQIP